MNPFIQTLFSVLVCSGLWQFLTEVVKNKFSKKNGIEKSIDDVQKSIEQLKQMILTEKHDRQEEDAKKNRETIVRFNDELLASPTKHSRSTFDTILMDCTDYENYCKKNPDFQNGVATEAIINIRRVYRECEGNKDFL